MRFKTFLALEAAQKEYKDFDEWQAAVKAAHPEFADKIQFKFYDKDDQYSAEVRGMDRSFGTWHGDETGHGVVLESK